MIINNEDKRLPIEFKTKFLFALRSGSFKQGTTYLYSSYDDTYCCIGIAARICGILLEVMDRQCLFNDHSKTAREVARKHNFPELLIGSDSMAKFDANIVVTTLVRMNDGGKTFLDIANWIETEL